MDKRTGRQPESGEREHPRKGRKAYATPSLVEYGSVAKLTQGTLTRQSDGKTGGFKRKNCL